MSKKRILLEFREQDYNDLVQRQEKAESTFKELVNYCEQTLEIEIEDFNSFNESPKQYCIDAYWKKYGLQFGNAPVKKEKAMNLTGWSDSKFDSLLHSAKIALSGVGAPNLTILPNELKFKIDREEFKTYLREEDEEMYNLTAEFIDMANKMEQAGGKAAWYLARYYPSLAVDGENNLTHSKYYFKETAEQRKRSMFSTIS
ncbi:hypothetical protein SAMN05444483_10987 [Salegentibacter echinorum]|uniref:Uncharacterized protein n=1 Tax=Salegentibacter echinorum TaxID=1073325 RepID=A0A1M5J2B2_SALEC|nr:hypothetical protein [Salegentibacter echinorum]SHG34737.1 hypothetical protein SAMN05444483_10987 [Salegentibacter echinorum]